jgi:hypothetical protein
MLDPAFLKSSYLSTINAGIVTWLSGFPYTVGTAHVDGLVEMSFTTAKAPEIPGFPRPVVGGSINPVVATQRRRVDRLR